MKEVKLGDIIAIRRGLTYSKGDEVDSSNKIVLRSNNVDLNSHHFDYSELKYLNPKFDIPKDKYLQKGELLMCMSNGSKAHLGKVAFYDGDSDKYAFGGFMSAISYNDSVVGRYLFYSMTTTRYKDYIKSLSEGANINNLKFRDIENFSIPLPSLPEQERIVAFLDEQFARIDTLKANAAAQLQAAKDLFQAALKEMLTPKEGWSVVKIGDIFKTYAGGTPLSTKKEYYTNGKIPWINSGEVCQKYIETTKNFITELGLKNSTAKFFPINTVLIALYGATAAQAGILKFEATSNQAVCGLLPNEKMLPEYVYYWFVLNKMKFSSMAQGGAQPNLSQIKVKAMPIPNIPLKEQINICNKLSEIEDKVQQLQANYDKTITLCNDLKQALLKSIFE